VWEFSLDMSDKMKDEENRILIPDSSLSIFLSFLTEFFSFFFPKI